MKQLIKTISVLIPFCLLAACGGVEKIERYKKTYGLDLKSTPLSLHDALPIFRDLENETAN